MKRAVKGNGSSMRLRFSGRAAVVSLIVVWVLLPLPTIFDTAEAIPPDYDMDNAGNHVVRDDDGTREATVTQYQGDEIYKRLWVYHNNIEDADRIHLWIYGRLHEGSASATSHEVYINDVQVMSFSAKKNFVPGEWRWRSFNLEKDDLVVGACNEILIRSKQGVSTILDIGVDTDFRRVNDGLGVCHDFDRSYWYDAAPVPTMHWPNQFSGEFMIHLEFIAVHEGWSGGFQTQTTVNKVLQHTSDPPPASDWDSAGIIIDWTGMDQATFERIYKARLWVYCKPDGLINYNDDDAFGISVNGVDQWYFNPWKELPHGSFSWLITTIFDISGTNMDNLDYGANGFNKINIFSFDHDDVNNNLQIAHLSDTDNGLNFPSTWWYIKTGSDPDTYDGDFEDPGDCTGELVIYVEVFLSDLMKDPNSEVFRYGSSAVIDNRDGDFNGYSMTAPNALKADFDGHGTYQYNFLIAGDEVRQFTIYGEQRAPSESEVGDCSDIYFHYGPGDPDRPNNPGTITLYEGRKVNLQWLFGDAAYHNNDDRHDFTSAGVTLTEAEGNDFSVSEEDDGSNGFNFDLEWLFIFSPGVFNSGANSWYQTLLWHGAHGVYGFDDVTPQELEDIMEDFYELGLNVSTVNTAFRNMCNWNDVAGKYFYNTDNPNDWMWGKDQIAFIDSLDRDNIDFRSTDD